MHLTGGILRHFRALSKPEQNPALEVLSTPAHPQVTQTVGRLSIVSKIMKKSIVTIVFSLLFLMSCIGNSFNQLVNPYSPTLDISALQTSAFQTVYAEAMSTATSTKTPTPSPTLTSTSVPMATPTVIFTLVYSDVIGANCVSGVAYNPNTEVLKLVTQLPSDIITPPPGVDIDIGSWDLDSNCFFISIPRKHGGGYIFWDGENNIIYWSEGTTPGVPGFGKINNIGGGWGWLAFLTLTKDFKAQTDIHERILSLTGTPTSSTAP